jgi:DedD protein
VTAPELSKQTSTAVAAAAEPGAATGAPGDSQPTTSGPLGDWVVQMGSFSSEQNALRLRDRLREAKFVTQVEKVQINGKAHFRVRVGPYLERADAERDQKKLAQSFDLKGRVLAYP